MVKRSATSRVKSCVP